MWRLVIIFVLICGCSPIITIHDGGCGTEQPPVSISAPISGVLLRRFERVATLDTSAETFVKILTHREDPRGYVPLARMPDETDADRSRLLTRHIWTRSPRIQSTAPVAVVQPAPPKVRLTIVESSIIAGHPQFPMPELQEVERSWITSYWATAVMIIGIAMGLAIVFERRRARLDSGWASRRKAYGNA